jgi:hypothetical protein
LNGEGDRQAESGEPGSQLGGEILGVGLRVHRMVWMNECSADKALGLGAGPGEERCRVAREYITTGCSVRREA